MTHQWHQLELGSAKKALCLVVTVRHFLRYLFPEVRLPEIGWLYATAVEFDVHLKVVGVWSSLRRPHSNDGGL